MYTLEELKQKSLKELKDIGWQLNVLPEGDRRCRQSWIDALVGVTPPLLKLLEDSPAASVDQVQDVIEQAAKKSLDVDRVQEPPLESKFGRIVYPRPAQEPIAQEAKTSPGVDTNVDVDRVQDIIDQTWTSWEKEHCVWLKSANWCIHQGENKRIEAFLPNSKTLRLEGMKKGAGYCAICEVSECTYDFNGLPLPVCTSLYAQEAIASAAKTSPAVEVDPVSEPIAQVAETCPGVEVYRTEEPIMETAETCPGVEVDRVQEPIVPVAETCPGVEVDRVQEPIIEMVETFPAASVEQAQEAIAPAAKNLPGSRLKTSTAHQLLELFKSSAHIIEGRW